MEKPTLYPLTTAQKMHYFTLRFCPKKEVLNIGTSLVIQDQLDFDLLRESIARVYDRYETMRVRFTVNEKGETMQYIVPKEDRPVEFFDFSEWSWDAADAKMREWSEIPFEREQSSMSRVVMVQMPDGYRGLYLNVDHMILDSFGITVFMKDLIEIYCSLKFDYPYPRPLGSYVQALEKDLAYEANSKGQQRDREYWQSFLDGPEPFFTDIEGPGLLEAQRKSTGNPELRAARITSESVEARHRLFHLDKEPTNRLMQFCADKEVPMVCLLMMGLRTYLSKENGFTPDVSIKSTVSRRATVLNKKAGGTRIHFFPCRTVIGEGKSFLEGIHDIRTAQNTLFRHANFDPIEFMSMRSKHYGLMPGAGYECMSLTYQPASLKARQDMPDIKYRCKWHSNGAAASPLYLTVMHNTEDEGLDFYFEYQVGRVPDDRLEYMYYYLLKIIFMGVEHPDMSVGQIMHTV